MATPSIQVLITQAQEVLNLQSSNEIRATLAAVLANANVGTPLNPNLTTQQLWNEFDEIVRQSTDDILSIIVDQMMRFVYAPPAPGGAGADKQVIFNDMGVLAGDAGLVYNKTTDALTVGGLVTAGSATITGDLTVRTTGLLVTSTGVGVGVTPATNARLQSAGTLTVSGGASASAANGLHLRFDTAIDTAYISAFHSGVDNRDLIYDAKTHGWLLPAGTAMTLNSTGLGIGVSPTVAFDLQQTSPMARITSTSTTGYSSLTLRNTGASGRAYGITVGGSGTGATAAGNLFITDDTASATRLVLDPSGNVGIGVTPSAWSGTFRALDIGSGCLVSQPANQTIGIFANAFENGTNYTRKATGLAAGYNIYNGAHYWLNAPTGTAATTFSFGNAAMTLDASGNLLVGTTSNAPASTQSQFVNQWSGGAKWGSTFNQTVSSATSYTHIAFCTNGTVRGSIDANNVTLTYGIVSDYRLKENVQPILNSLARIAALKPSTYKWKDSGTDGEGFIAHELASVVPLAVIGQKDAVNEDGSIKAQQIDLSKVVPILVAAIQELTARVQTLEAR